MKIIAELTDLDILGTPGRSDAKPRRTARAIVRREDGRYAVMYAEKFDLYTLPGGGAEEGEDVLTALHREVMEETGCLCREIRELGLVLENRAHCDYTQESYYYVVTARPQTQPALTDGERQNGSVCQWHPLDEAIRLIRDRVHNTAQRKFLQARDLAALREYRSK